MTKKKIAPTNRQSTIQDHVRKLDNIMRNMADIRAELKDWAKDARHDGLTPSVLKRAWKEREQAADDRIRKREEEMDEVRHALGILGNTSLGQAALARAA